MDTSTKYLASTTPEQKSELVEFLKSHPELISGKFTNDFSFKKARGLWESLANTLNAMPGAKKDWKKWRKAWHDIKTRTKSKSSKLKQSRLRTGGGPPIHIEMTKDDEKILGIMGSVVVEGHPNVAESQVLFEDNAVANPTEMNIYDADYPVDLETMETSTDIINSPDSESNNLTQLTEAENITKPSSTREKTQKRRTPRRLQRLEKTITATEALAQQTERDINMRDNYYKQKLQLLKEDINQKRQLLKEDIAVKARIASALESMAETIREIL